MTLPSDDGEQVMLRPGIRRHSKEFKERVVAEYDLLPKQNGVNRPVFCIRSRWWWGPDIPVVVDGSTGLRIRLGGCRRFRRGGVVG